MLDFVVEIAAFVIELAGEVTISLWTSKDSRAERLNHLRRKRRKRKLARWLKKGERRGPVPNIGLTCLCGYLLTGLTGDICPKCGRQIDFELLAR